MDDDKEKKPTGSEGAMQLGLTAMHPEIANVNYSDLHHDPETEVPWTYVRSGKGLTIWILSKKRR